MTTLFLTARKLIILDILPKYHEYNQQYFVNYVCPNLKKVDLSFQRRMPESTFWAHMDNSMCHNGSKVMSKFLKRQVSRCPHPPDSPDRSPYDFWLFVVLKETLKDQEFNSSDEIEEAIPRV
jgi:hypothetical protein